MFKVTDNSDIVAIIVIALSWNKISQSFPGMVVEIDQYMRGLCTVLGLCASELDTIYSVAINIPAAVLPKVFDLALLVRYMNIFVYCGLLLTYLCFLDIRGHAPQGRLGGQVRFLGAPGETPQSTGARGLPGGGAGRIVS
jgi:hypothetical protein